MANLSSIVSRSVTVLLGLAILLAGCGSSSQDFVFNGNGAVPSLVSLQLAPATQTIAVGATQAYTLTATLSDGSTANVADLATWTSSQPAVATVSDTGVASGLSAGATTIQAALGGLTASADLTVSNAVLTSLSVTPANPTILVGATQQFQANALFSDQTVQNVTGSATWTSSNEAVATIDDNGLATGVSAGGPVTITATFGAQQATASLTVSTVPVDDPVATSLNFVTGPSDSLAGQAIAPAVQVEVLDQNGTRLDTNATITLFFGNNPSGATLAGPSATAVNGLATFDTLSVNLPGVGYTLAATGAGVNPVISDPFNVNLVSGQFDLFGLSLALPAQADPGQGGAGSARWSANGDFNNDGRLDAVTVIGNQSFVRVHLRQADGRFTPVDFNVANASAVVAGDLDNDGDDDFLVLRRDSALKTVFLSNGDGSFAAGTDSAAPPSANSLALVNATGDALPDLVIVSESSDELNLYENVDGAVIFSGVPDETVALTADGEAVAGGNLDGSNDGLDVVVGLSSGANDVAIFYDYDATTNSFGSTTAIPANGTIRALALGNVDAANGLDIVCGTSTGVDSLLNDGNASPTFTSSLKANNLFPAPNMSVANHPQAIAVGNLEADADDEVVVADVSGSVQSLRIFLDITSADLPLLVEVPHNPLSLTLGDFTGDGLVDISALNRSNSSPGNLSSSSTLALLLADGNGGFGPTRLGTDNDNNTQTETSVSHQPTVADVNGDGFPDLMVASSAVDAIQIWLGDGTGDYPTLPDIQVSTITGQAADQFETTPVDVVAVDVDGANGLDLVIADNTFGFAGGRVFLNDGAANPTFSADDANALPIDRPNQVLTAELDGDANLELVFRSSSAGLITVANGTYPFSGGEVFNFASAGANDLAAGFLNGDAFADLVGSAGDGIVVFYNDGSGAFGPAVHRTGPGSPPANINRVASGDLDGDGLWDVAASQANSNQVHLFFSLGTSFEDLSFTTTQAESPQGMAIGDLNDDGLNDLVVAGRAGACVGVYLGQGGRFLSGAGSLLSGIVSQVALADLNNDNLLDIVAGSSTGAEGLFPIIQQTSP